MKKWTGLLVTAGIAIALAAIVTAYRYNVLSGEERALFRAISDGTFVSAVALLFAGILGWVSQAGGFDGFAYMWYALAYKLTPSKKQFLARQSYYDFKIARHKADKRRPNALLVGAVMFLISLLLSMIFMLTK